MTLSELKKIYFTKNIRVDRNNYQDSRGSAPLPNDAISLWDSVTGVISYLNINPTSTDLSVTTTGSTVTIVSSSGTDAIVSAATTSNAGVMSATDKVNLAALSTLSGVTAGALNLGTFTGTIIPDNLTIKAALQSLETYAGTIAINSFGNLTPATSAVTITNGTGAVRGIGAVVGIVPANILLTTLGGSLSLYQLSTTSAVSGDVISFNGTSWVSSAVPTVSIDHNSLTGIQGGISTEYYHLKQSIYNSLTTASTNTLIGRDAAGSGEITNIAVAQSIEFNGSNAIRLVNDVSTPSNWSFYGTNGSGVKGWTLLPTYISSVGITSSSNITLAVTNPTTTPNITADLTDTTVIAGEYGSALDIPIITVDSKGRISSVIEAPITITTGAIASFTEDVQDIIGSTILAGTGITVTYNDTLGTVTIDSSIPSGISGTGTINRIPFWLNSTTLTDDADLMFDGSYLTIGSPSAGSLSRITSKGTGTTQSTFGYVHQSSSGTEVLKVSDVGSILIGALGEVFIHPDAINLGTGGTFPISVAGGNMYLYSDETVEVESGGLTTSKPSLTSIATRNSTSTAQYNFKTLGNFSPTLAGTNTYTDLLVAPIINQITHTGITYGARILPTLTAASNFIGLEITATGHTALKTLAGKVSFTLGSDLTGDLFYRDSAGNLKNLAIGTTGDVLTVDSGLPAWQASTSGALPGGSTGDILVYNGAAYVSVSPITETQTGITGVTVTLAATPLAYTLLTIYRNGVYQVITDDFTIAGATITLGSALVSTDKITAIYYI